MSEAAIETTGTVLERKGPILYSVELMNGKKILGHLSKALTDAGAELADGDTVVTTQSIVDVDLADSRMFNFQPGTTLDDLVRAVNEVGAAPGDLMAILEALRQAGALHGELVVI